VSYEEEDTCVSYEEEDTCVSYEEKEDKKGFEDAETIKEHLSVSRAGAIFMRPYMA